MTERFFLPDGSPDVEFEKAFAERQQQIALERIQHRRERALAYLHSHPEQMQANRLRARAAADRKRRADPIMRRKLEIYDRTPAAIGPGGCLTATTAGDSHPSAAPSENSEAGQWTP